MEHTPEGWRSQDGAAAPSVRKPAGNCLQAGSMYRPCFSSYNRFSQLIRQGQKGNGGQKKEPVAGGEGGRSENFLERREINDGKKQRELHGHPQPQKPVGEGVRAKYG